MTFTQVLFNPQGRITQGQFWGGWAVLVIANILAMFIPLLGLFVILGLIYVGICVYGKRLHDMGRTAWLHAIPWILGIALMIGMIASMWPVILTIAENPEIEPDPQMMMQQGGTAMILWLVSLLMWVLYTIWVGASRSQDGENIYGPVPGQYSAVDTFN